MVAGALLRTNPSYPESLLLAALYAAQSYIVVAPNYAGFDSSTLGYYPYLNAEQSSKEMIDTLRQCDDFVVWVCPCAEAPNPLVA